MLIKNVYKSALCACEAPWLPAYSTRPTLASVVHLCTCLTLESSCHPNVQVPCADQHSSVTGTGSVRCGSQGVEFLWSVLEQLISQFTNSVESSYFLLSFEIGSHCEALDVLKLTEICLLNAGIKGVYFIKFLKTYLFCTQCL